MPKDKSNVPSRPAAAAASSALATQPETLPRAEVMAQKGYTSEQLFKLALSGIGLDPRAEEIPLACLDTLPRFEGATNGHQAEELPKTEPLLPLIEERFDSNPPVPRIVALQLIGITDDELCRELKARNLDPKAEILEMATVSQLYESHSLARQEALEYLGFKEQELVEVLTLLEEDPKAKTLTLATIERIEQLPTQTLLEQQADAMKTAMRAAQERQLSYYRNLAEQMNEQAETAALTLVASSATTFHETLFQAFDALAQTQNQTYQQMTADFLESVRPEGKEEQESNVGKARRRSFQTTRKATTNRQMAQQIFYDALKTPS
jgi:hypothetical protein